MSEWGPGSPDMPMRAREQVETDSMPKADPQPPEEEKESEEAERLSEDQTELYDYENPADLFEGSGYNAMRFGEYAFLPVFGFNEANIAARKYTIKHGFEDDDTTIGLDEDDVLMIGDRELTWWEDNSIMPKHPFMLVNPLGFASVDPDVHNFREVFRCSKGEQFVFADSGGYQLMSMDDAEIVDDPDEHQFTDYRIYPERLVEWQTENADAGATIDFPPYNISGDSSFPDAVEHNADWQDFFTMRRERSAEMTERMATKLSELRESGSQQAQDYVFAPVIQAKPHPQDHHYYVRAWHESMKEAANSGGVDPRGWVLKPEPSKSFGQNAMFLAYAEEYLQEVDYIHVLMVGGMLQKALIMYYAKFSDHFVTSDASSYAAGGMRRQFNLPNTADRRSVIISSRDEDADNAASDPNHLDRFPCRCQVCSTVKNDVGFEFISEGSGSARSVCLNLHNLHQSLNIERTLDALLREDGIDLVEPGGKPTGCEFWRYVSGLASEKRIKDLYDAMSYLKVVREEGLTTANKQFRIHWETNQGRTIKYGGGSAGRTNW